MAMESCKGGLSSGAVEMTLKQKLAPGQQPVRMLLTLIVQLGSDPIKTITAIGQDRAIGSRPMRARVEAGQVGVAVQCRLGRTASLSRMRWPEDCVVALSQCCSCPVFCVAQCTWHFSLSPQVLGLTLYRVEKCPNRRCRTPDHRPVVLPARC